MSIQQYFSVVYQGYVLDWFCPDRPVLGRLFWWTGGWISVTRLIKNLERVIQHCMINGKLEKLRDKGNNRRWFHRLSLGFSPTPHCLLAQQRHAVHTKGDNENIPMFSGETTKMTPENVFLLWCTCLAKLPCSESAGKLHTWTDPGHLVSKHLNHSNTLSLGNFTGAQQPSVN